MGTTKSSITKYTEEHAAMLKEAIARPGVREVMEVYRNWRMSDASLDNYRKAGGKRPRAVVSDRANTL